MKLEGHLAVCLLYIVGCCLLFEAQHRIWVDARWTVCLEICVPVLLFIFFVGERIRLYFLLILLAKRLLLTWRHIV